VRNFAPQAQADLDEAVGWLLDQGFAAAAAEKLLNAVLDAAAMLAKRPGLGRHRPDLLPEPFRFWSIPRHDLILVYDPDAEAPTILRVLSTNQDLGPLIEDFQAQLGETRDDAGID
jgi:plasmid stabilization system protein ParE